MAGSFALSFSHNFLSIFVHISGSIWPITLIWVSEWKDLFFLAKGDDVRSGRKAKVLHGRWLRLAKELMGNKA